MAELTPLETQDDDEDDDTWTAAASKGKLQKRTALGFGAPGEQHRGTGASQGLVVSNESDALGSKVGGQGGRDARKPSFIRGAVKVQELVAATVETPAEAANRYWRSVLGKTAPETPRGPAP
mmetsp:Transcript_177326/g.562613  ORF Transcript_177326/g.562613 Transcript_177326/m.562613 type:complete len:122 (-) Transcript_177326:74-439(-)